MTSSDDSRHSVPLVSTGFVNESPSKHSMTIEKSLVEKMRREWDDRAKENARYYVATAQASWSDEEYFESGRQNVYHEILTDMGNVCQGRDPKSMTVLEIGCGSGRITRALS